MNDNHELDSVDIVDLLDNATTYRKKLLKNDGLNENFPTAEHVIFEVAQAFPDQFQESVKAIYNLPEEFSADSLDDPFLDDVIADYIRNLSE